MEKVYNPIEIEPIVYRKWEEKKLFKLKNESAGPYFSIFYPVFFQYKKVSVDHIFTSIVTDIIVRRKHMQKFNILVSPVIYAASMDFIEIIQKLGLALDWSQINHPLGDLERQITSRFFVKLYRQGVILLEETPNSNNWFLKIPATTELDSGTLNKIKINFIPKTWQTTFANWIENSQNLCISHQSHEGFPIPAYYCGLCKQVMVTEGNPGACDKCGSAEIYQESGFLNSWWFLVFFLFASMGSENNAWKFKNFYPTSLMVSAHGTLYPFVFRMIILGSRMGKDIPFRDLLVQGILRVDKDLKNIESKQPGAKPSTIIKKYGSDVLRFTLASVAAPGLPSRISEKSIKNYKAFSNKIWNASRFVLKNLRGDENIDLNVNKITDTDKWILNCVNNIIVKVNDLLDKYKINKAASLLYKFFWHEYCDWYLEFSKIDLGNMYTRRVLKFSLFKLLQLSHPFMPYLTDTIFQRLNIKGKGFLIETEYPNFRSDLVFSNEYAWIEIVKKLIKETRKLRVENKITHNRRIKTILITKSEGDKKWFERNRKYFNVLARSFPTEVVSDSANLPRGFLGKYQNWKILLPFESEKERLEELAKLEKEMEIVTNKVVELEEKIFDKNFVNNHHQSVVFNLKKHLQNYIDKKIRIRRTIDDLS